MNLNNQGQLLFLVSLSIWVSFFIIESSFLGIYIDPYDNFFKSGCMVLLVFSELLENHFSAKSLLAFFPMCLFSLTCYLAGLPVISFLFLFAYCTRHYSFRIIAKCCLCLTTALFLLILISAFLGLIPNYISYEGSRMRQYLGFRYALVPAQYMFSITCLFVYIMQKRIIQVSIPLILANIFILIATGSRLSPILSIGLVLAACILPLKKNRLASHSIFKLVVCSVFVVSALVTISISVLYEPSSLLQNLNAFFNQRLQQGSIAINKYGFSLFGQYIEWAGNGVDFFGNTNPAPYQYVDFGFLRTAIQTGVIVTAILVILLTWSINRSWILDNKYLVAVLYCIGLHLFVDDLCLFLYYNPFLLLIGYALCEHQNNFADNEYLNIVTPYKI